MFPIANSIFLLINNFILMSLVSTPIIFDDVSFESVKKENKDYLSQAGKSCKYDGEKYEKGDKITLSDGTQMVCSDPPKWDIL